MVSLAEAEDSTVVSLEDMSEDDTSGSLELDDQAPSAPLPTSEPDAGSAPLLAVSPGSIPERKWYHIKFSPTAFCKRVFQSVCPEPAAWETNTGEKPGSGGARDMNTEDRQVCEVKEMPDLSPEKETEPRVGPTAKPVVDLQVQRCDQPAITSPIAVRPNSVSWYKDEEASSATEHSEVVEFEPCCSLTLIQNSGLESGVYSCLPRTSGREMSHSALISADSGVVDVMQERVHKQARWKLLSLYEIHEEIGRGAFGVVRRATHRETGKMFAAKFLPLRREESRTRAFREQELLSRLAHPRVACLHDSFCTRRTLVLLTDLCSNRGLLEHLLSKGSVAESEVKIYIHQVLEGLDHIHSRNILHLDIKPDNIIMALCEGEAVKICDFGFSQEIDPTRELHSEFGMPEFVAPEIVRQQPVTKATDIWSLGVLSYLCLTGHCPFFGESDRDTLLSVRDARLRWDLPHVTSRSQQGQDFLRRLLQADPAARPSAAECMEHEWFQDQPEHEETNKINSKNLKLFVSRSKWQRSLTCYGSILVLRPISDLLAAPPHSRSGAAAPGYSSLSTSASSSSDLDKLEDWVASNVGPRQRSTVGAPDGDATSMTLGRSVGLVALGAKTQGEEVQMGALGMGTILERQSLTSDTSKLDEGVCVEHGSPERTGQPPSQAGCIPRSSLIRSTFHASLEGSEELSPLSARRLLLRQRRHVSGRLRPSRSLSGRLDEPLLELEEEEGLEADAGRSQSLGSLASSLPLSTVGPFDGAGRHSEGWRRRPSRSLEVLVQRTPSEYELWEQTAGSSDVGKEDTSKGGCEGEALDRLAETGTQLDLSEAVLDSNVDEDVTQEVNRCSSLDSIGSSTGRPEIVAHSMCITDALKCKKSKVVNLVEDLSKLAATPTDRHGDVSSGDTDDDPGVSSKEPIGRPDPLKPLFVESTTPVSVVQDVAKLLTSQYCAEPLEKHRSSLMCFQALETLEMENRSHFPKIHKARSDSGIPKRDFAMVTIHSATSYEEPHGNGHHHYSPSELEEAVAVTEDFNESVAKDEDPQKKESHKSFTSSQFLFTVPKMVITPSDYCVVESAEEAFSSHDQDEMCDLAASSQSSAEPDVGEKDFEGFYESTESSGELYNSSCPERGQEETEEVVQPRSSGKISPDLIQKEAQCEQANLVQYILDGNRQFSQAKQSIGSSTAQNPGMLSVPSECHLYADTELHLHTASSLGVDPRAGKKLGLLRFFRRQSWTVQSSTPVEKVVKRQASDGDSAEQNRIPDLSISKKVKAGISKVVLGKQSCKEDRKEAAMFTAETAVEANTEAAGSTKRTPALFSFKLPGFKRSKEPVFLQELTDQSVFLGQKVTLRCQIQGHPTPLIHWYKEGRRLKSSNHIRLAALDRELLSLTISSAKDEDLGSYRCVARNVLGQTSTSCTLIVSELPASPASPEVLPLHRVGLLLVWTPVQSISELTYCIEHSMDGGEWQQLGLGLSDSCYVASNLPQGAEHRFRVACQNRAGSGPFSEPSVPTVIGPTDQELHAPLIPMDTPWPYDCGGTAQHLAPPPFSSTWNTYTFLSEISRGRFSVVTRCQEDQSGTVFAAKITPFTAERRQWALNEYQVLKRLQHTHLARLHAALVWPQCLALVQELCPGQELLYHLAERDLYGEMHVQKLLQQVLSAVHYLHQSHVLHLDLRSENLLVGESSLVKVVDLGSAQNFVPGHSLPGEHLECLTGHPAPEILEGLGVGPETDIWAIGVLTFIMLSGDDPFPPHVHSERVSMAHSRRPKANFGQCYTSVSEGALSFLKRSLSSKARTRPSAAECLQFPWIQNVCQPSKHRDTVVCFPTDRLRAYLRDRAPSRDRTKTVLEVPLSE